MFDSCALGLALCLGGAPLPLPAPLASGEEPAGSSQADWDLVIYGGTSAGVVAAVQAARLGRSVVLLEPGRHLGGLSSGGLGATDIGNKAAIGGLAREFYRRLRRHYDDPASWRFERREDFRGRGHVAGDDAAWTFEPHVAEAVFREMLAETSAEIVHGERLDLAGGVSLVSGRIASVRMESGRQFRGRVFVDATYEGDLMAGAGVSWTLGRESGATYGETLNGVQTAQARHHQFVKRVDPYVRRGDPESGLLPRLHAGPPGLDGEGDHRIQAYCFRLCATDHPQNRVPWPRPEDYDETRYELLLRNFEAGDHRIPWNPVLMPNKKTDSNNNFAFSTDNIGMNYEYPAGDYATRERIVAEHESYQKGLMWTLAHHPRVPEKVRETFQRFGLSRDEFVDNGHWPHQLYIREARRMVADYVMTEHECRGFRRAEDSVGLGAYNMDSHHVQRYVTEDGAVLNEGDVQVRAAVYGIAWRSLVPPAGECTNLVVPVCLSASHIAFGSIRMEPVFMVLGHSAASAASLAIELGCAVQDLPYARLREQLLAEGQILDPPGSAPRAGIPAASLPGLVIDDEDAERVGFEIQSTSVAPWVATGYRHDDDRAKGEQSMRYRPDLPRAGLYEVRLSYSAHSNRARRVPVAIHHATGTNTRTVDQTRAPPLQGAWISLGSYQFRAGREGWVEITTRGTRGHVIADAVWFLPEDG